MSGATSRNDAVIDVLNRARSMELYSILQYMFPSTVAPSAD